MRRTVQIGAEDRWINDDGNFTLGPLDLAFGQGELVFLIGGNGSGKTTLAKLLTGLYAPEAGKIRLDGQKIDDRGRVAYRQYFSAVFSDFYLFDTIQQENKRRTGEVEARFESQLARQRQFVNRFRFFSPAVVMQEALNEIAGTGLLRYQRFREQVAQHDRRWTEFFLPRIYKNEKLTGADYDAVPRFRFVEEPASAIALRAGFGLTGLLLPTLMIGALALRAVKKCS